MGDFWIYVKLGLEHVLDLAAYDHILFLTALTTPFRFKSWRKVLFLATVFTVTHCTSLALSAYNVLRVDVGLIEFLIPVTIALTSVFNLYNAWQQKENYRLLFHSLATAFFGLVHGFGFSNFFNMMMAEEENKLLPLVGFASGIELSQIIVVLWALLVSFVVLDVFKLKQRVYVMMASLVIILITIPMMFDTFPF